MSSEPGRRVVAITGATGGVGRATARAFAEAGYDVALIARGRVGLHAVSDEVAALGGRSCALEVDVADAVAVEAATERIERELGPIDVWVNNAMTTIFAPLADITPDEFERATRVTYLGQVHGTMSALRRMRARDRGVIVSVGSALAYRAIALQAPYCGAKFATRGFHEAVRTELRHDASAVRVVQVHLPAINTPQFGWCRNRTDREPMPVPPIYQPEVAAKAILGAAERPRRQRVVGTWNWLLIQFSQLFPGMVDHYAAATTAEGQLTDRPADPTAPGNLYEPADGPGGRDHGAHGGFDERSGGVLDPAFLSSLPTTGVDMVRAVTSRSREIWSDHVGRRRAPARDVPSRAGSAQVASTSSRVSLRDAIRQRPSSPLR